MVLRLTGDSGYPKDAFSVTWSMECSNGHVLCLDTAASRLSLGEYGVDWIVSVSGGTYFVRWKWHEFSGSPLSSKIDTFQVVDPKTPKAGVVKVGL